MKKNSVYVSLTILITASLLLSCSPANLDKDETVVVDEAVTYRELPQEEEVKVEEQKEAAQVEKTAEEIPLKPAEFVVENLTISPDEVTKGKSSSVTVNVTNIGEMEGDYEVIFKLDDEVIETKTVTLTTGTTETVNFFFYVSKSGRHTLDVNGLSGTLIVKLPSYELRGTVFFDYNGNGLQDNSELTLEGVILQSGNSTTRSLVDGSYLLNNLTQGEIHLIIVKPGFPFVALSLAQVFPAVDVPLNITGDTQLNIGLMQGWMTLPFESEKDAFIKNYVDLDHQIGRIRPFSDANSKWVNADNQQGDNHQGIDWSAEKRIPILAVAPGIAFFAGNVAPNGAIGISILHPLGTRSFVTQYGHISESLVNSGDLIKRGQVIAVNGMTGTSTPHLHFNMWEVPPFRSVMDPIFPYILENYPNITYPNGYVARQVLDPFRDVTDPLSESFWTVDNLPQYVKRTAK